MMRFTRCQLGLAVALSALTAAAYAQQPAHSTPSGTSAAAPTANAQPAHANKAHATRKHSTAHHAMGHGNRPMAADETTKADSAYKAALRQCVTGAESARDRCLDEAIARYGHA